MKRKITLKISMLFIAVILINIGIFAQPPSAVSFQSVVRNSSGDLVQSGLVGIKITIQTKSKTGFTDRYSETHTATTNENGLITLEVGRGTAVLGTFSGINWSMTLVTYHLKVETDPNGGTSYISTGTSEILSTPFSLLADEARTVQIEEDPDFNASVAKNITTTDINNWNSITLDDAYDAGRLISAENGPVEIVGNDGILVKGNFGGGNDLSASGNGARMFWFPKNAAFRAGYVFTDQWNENNLGHYSTAFGYSTLASGNYSTALGSNTKAIGETSTTMGSNAEATGITSTAMGSHTEASGDYSTAIGSRTKATMNAATAMGYYTEANGMASIAGGDSCYANGDASVALGYHTTADADASTAMGAYTEANGLGSTALGTFAKAMNPGSFVIGDISTYGGTNTFVTSSAANQMTMRFAGGYKFYTNSTTTIGASLVAGANSWSSISDSTKKENFQSVKGDYFLNSLSKLKLGSWNYKGQIPELFRHYGPMAQEIYHYFGNDGLGTIGCDTTLASADMDGIMMICLQALERRTSSLDEQNKKLAESNQLLEQRLAAVESIVRQMVALNEEKKNNIVAQKETE